MTSWNEMNILEYIDWLMDQGISEENAYEIANAEFNCGEESSEEEDDESCRYCGTRKVKGYLCMECGRI